MPSHKVHRAIDKLFLGKEFDMVHKLKDAPASIVGPSHRKYFHDHLTNALIGLAYGPQAFISAELHDWADKNFIEKNGRLYLRKPTTTRKQKKRKKRKSAHRRKIYKR